SVVDVTDGADIDVRLGALKFGFSHDTASSFVCFRFSSPPEPPGRVLQIIAGSGRPLRNWFMSGSLARRLGDDLIGDVLRHFLVMVKLHDVGAAALGARAQVGRIPEHLRQGGEGPDQDRKSTRLNSSHVKISYAVFCLK